MTKNRNILLGSLLLLIPLGTLFTLSKLEYGAAKSSPILHSARNELRSDPPVEASTPVKDSKSQAEIQASLEREWERFTTTKFCFLGSEDYRPGKDSDEKSFGTYGWLPSAKENLDGAITFLLERVPSKKRTKAHVCPFDDATEGELAVYSLQHILKRNWYELNDEYKSLYANRPEDKEIYGQDLLRGIIQNKNKVREMIDEWKMRYEESRASIH